MPLNTTTNSSIFFSPPTLFRVFIALRFLSLSLLSSFFLFHHPYAFSSSSSRHSRASSSDFIKVYAAGLLRSFNYGLLDEYWSFDEDSRLGSDADREIRSKHLAKRREFPPYPENPLVKQFSAEYWIMGDLMTPLGQRTASYSRRVFDASEADVVLAPFFASLSAEMQLGMGKGVFRKKEGNEDYRRQRKEGNGFSEECRNLEAVGRARPRLCYSWLG